MAWPPSSNIAAGFQSEGATPAKLAWGTEGLYTGVILKSIRSSRMVENIRVENGTGLTAALVQLFDGDEVELTVVDDRGINFPEVGSNLTLAVNPIGTFGSTNVNLANQVFLVENSNYNGARKVEGERVILARKYILSIPGATNTP